MKIDRIRFERKPGMGGSRRYSAEIRANCDVFVSKLQRGSGRLYGTIQHAQLEELEEYLDEIDLLAMKNEYVGGITTCQPYNKLFVLFSDGSSKDIVRDISDSTAPQSLIDLEKRVESLAEAADIVPSHNCPICRRILRPVPRYPNYVCSNCVTKATDHKGRSLEFFNVDFSGGFSARYADSGEPYNKHICYIKGQLCKADEARFGGIVIEVIEEGTQLSFDDFISD